MQTDHTDKERLVIESRRNRSLKKLQQDNKKLLQFMQKEKKRLHKLYPNDKEFS
jgi:hypothetical protein